MSIKGRRKPVDPLGPDHWPELVALRLEGVSPREIAERMGVTATSVRKTIAHPDVAAMITREHRVTLEALRQDAITAASEALATLQRLASGDPDPDTHEPRVSANVQRQAATDILDRVLPKGVVIEQQHSGSVEMTMPGLVSAAELEAMTPEKLEALVKELEAVSEPETGPQGVH